MNILQPSGMERDHGRSDFRTNRQPRTRWRFGAGTWHYPFFRHTRAAVAAALSQNMADASPERRMKTR